MLMRKFYELMTARGQTESVCRAISATFFPFSPLKFQLVTLPNSCLIYIHL